MQIPIVRLALGDAEVEAAGRVIRSGWVAQGPEVAAFERELAAAVGAPFAVAVSNCTVALELSLRVAGVQPGDDVATVSHSFIATANAVVALGARPIFVDVQPDTYCMDPAALVRAITPRTRAILCVHQIGFPCDLPAILAVARPLGLPVIEDAACAIGSEIRIDGDWQRIGRPHGLLACFSFHPRKLITTGDGGAITTSDPSLAERLRLLRQHAMSLIWDSQRVPSPPAMGSGEQSPPLPTRPP
ncbi:MAG TPA: DegT/DnrJ/EryC1/StrS family aminotransferase, partial [Polyangia bacterium]|nr:DegT/DnrJ/EryC1/StrS family aminotransferase [Polyangia bacterium]